MRLSPLTLSLRAIYPRPISKERWDWEMAVAKAARAVLKWDGKP